MCLTALLPVLPPRTAGGPLPVREPPPLGGYFCRGEALSNKKPSKAASKDTGPGDQWKSNSNLDDLTDKQANKLFANTFLL